MSVKRYLAVMCVGIGLALTGCGTYVPDLTDPPATAGDTQLLVEAVVESIHCEIRAAIVDVIDADKEMARMLGARTAPWLETWGVQIGLTLQVEEKTQVNASTIWFPPTSSSTVFTLAGGGNIAASAVRIDKIGYYYTVEDLYARGKCRGAEPPPQRGSLLIRSDLKLEDWLYAHVISVGTGAVSVPTTINSPLKQNALSHEVKFEVLTGGNLTPSWQLVHATVNPASPFLSTNRNRIHDLLITFGPTEQKTDGLVGAAAASYLAAQIGLAVNNRNGF